MDSINFVQGIRKSVVEEKLTLYKDLFQNAVKPSDPYWKEALTFFQSLPPQSQQIFFKVIRQVEVDTVSNMLSIMDGVSFIEGQDDDIVLSFSKTTLKINGMLQDIFLEMEESKE